MSIGHAVVQEININRNLDIQASHLRTVNLILLISPASSTKQMLQPIPLSMGISKTIQMILVLIPQQMLAQMSF